MQPAKGQVEMTPEAAEEVAEAATKAVARASEEAAGQVDNAAFVKEDSPRSGSKSGKREADLRPENWH